MSRRRVAYFDHMRPAANTSTLPATPKADLQHPSARPPFFLEGRRSIQAKKAVRELPTAAAAATEARLEQRPEREIPA